MEQETKAQHRLNGSPELAWHVSNTSVPKQVSIIVVLNLLQITVWLVRFSSVFITAEAASKAHTSHIFQLIVELPRPMDSVDSN